jgi:hypothetical protein
MINKFRVLFPFFIISASISCVNKNMFKQSETEATNFLEWYIKQEEIKILVDKPLGFNFEELTKLPDSVSFKNDSINFMTQVNKASEYIYKKQQINGVEIIADSVTKNFKDPYPPFNRLSYPIVYNKGKYFLIFHYHMCGGLCGEGNLKIYTKEETGYKLVYFGFIWES